MFRPLETKFFVLVSVPSDPLQSGGSLTEVAQSVSSRMALLEPEQLAQADARLASLVERFNQVPESLQKLPDLTKEFFKQIQLISICLKEEACIENKKVGIPI